MIKSWSVDRIGAEKARPAQPGPLPIVAVLDTGLDVHHPDLRENLWTNPGEVPGDGLDNDGNGWVDDVHGIDAFHPGSGDVTDSSGHGTHVAGIIAATAGRVQLMPIKIFDRNGLSDADALIRALDYAHRMGATITNNSVGGAREYDEQVFQAYQSCPALHIMSAGNSCSDNDLVPHYPSSFELANSVAVAASSKADRLCFTSCYGQRSVDLAAPGEQIESTEPGGGYGVRSGTSQATPHVTGVASLIAETYPGISPSEIKERLLQGIDARPEMVGKLVTGGRLNALKAVAPLPE